MKIVTPARLYRAIFEDERAGLYRPGMTGADLLDAESERERQRYMHDFKSCSAKCDSPIEELLLGALIAVGRRIETVCLVHSDGPPKITKFHCPTVAIASQVPFGRYRPDFTIFDDRTLQRRITIIECDGHDFHERTKEQAQRDRSRDRWFTTQGVTVLRFTGSEIYRDPFKVADEIIDWLERPYSEPSNG